MIRKLVVKSLLAPPLTMSSQPTPVANKNNSVFLFLYLYEQSALFYSVSVIKFIIRSNL